jgi:gas vesicle protein
MREYDDVPYIVIERRSAGFAPFLWGAIVGGAAALLLAPRSGEETQAELRRRADQLRTGVEDRVTSAREAVTRTREQVQDRIDSVREVVGSRVDQVRGAVDSGRRAASDARSELERRVADAKESVQGSSIIEPNAAADRNPIVTEVVVTEVTVEDAEGQPGLG